MTIYDLDENPDRFIFASFPEYVAANVELASGIAGTLSDYVAYGEAKQKAEEFYFELDCREANFSIPAENRMGCGDGSRPPSHCFLLRRKR